MFYHISINCGWILWSVHVLYSIKIKILHVDSLHAHKLTLEYHHICQNHRQTQYILHESKYQLTPFMSTWSILRDSTRCKKVSMNSRNFVKDQNPCSSCYAHVQTFAFSLNVSKWSKHVHLEFELNIATYIFSNCKQLV